jgi:multidrug efflux pump subunit AcrA (membrane-fusion protein)
MRLRTVIVSVVLLAVVGGLAAVGFVTRDRWLPHVFPAPASSGHEHGEADHHAHADRVKLSAQAQANLALEVDTLVPREYWRTALIPGVVVDRPGESDRGVPTKVAGVVTDIKARPGDTVKAGDPLFTIQLVSEFVQSTQTELAKAAREREFAVARRDQTAILVKAGTKSERELLDEENQVKRLTTQIEGYRRQLLVFGLTPQQVDRAQRGEVVTEAVVPAPGGAGDETLYEVQELSVQLGAAVQSGQSLATLANHQRLFVEGRAFKSEADALATAAEKKIPIRAEFADETPGAWPPQSALVIHHLSNQVDPATRTFAFYLPLDNQPRTYTRDGRTHFVWRYRPGQRVRLKVPVEKLVTLAPDGKTEVLPFVLPVGAVVREGPEAFVFVQNGDVFVRKPVRVLYEDRSEVVIANDGSVMPADFVVKNQAAAINRALKAAAGGGGDHGHDHHGHSH